MPKVYVIEDSEFFADVLAMELQLQHNITDLRCFSRWADFELSDQSCDLLISDLNLPDSPAQNTASCLRSLSGKLHVVVFSADAQVGVMLEHQSLGKIPFYSKSMGCQAFVKFLAVHLGV